MKVSIQYFLITITTGALIASASVSSAYGMCTLLVNPTYFEGRDTVVYSVSMDERFANFASEQSILPLEKDIENILKKMFSRYPTIKLLNGHDAKVDIFDDPNVLGLDIEISLSKEATSKGDFQIASVAVILSRVHPIPLNGPSIINSDEYKLPSTYPFVMPQTKDAFIAKMSEAITYLASYLPSYLACDGRQSPCKIEYPYGRTGCDDTPSPPDELK